MLVTAGQLAHDASSPQVRVAVLVGVTRLMANPICHTLLKNHLASLQGLLYDQSSAVRAAFVDLLIATQ